MQAAIHSLKARKDSEEGFTLIELMVVVLIIAILIAIAIPTFLGARSRAQDRAAQSDLRNALVAAKTFYTDNENYTGFDETALTTIEPSLSAAVADADRPLTVASTDTTVTLERESASGKVFTVCDDVATGTTYGEDDATCPDTEW